MPIAIKDSKFDITSEESTKELAQKFSENLKGGEFIFLYGEMGVGKTTFVKYFMTAIQYYAFNNYTNNFFVSGYGNTTSAVDAVQFKFNSGNIDSGTIKLYGINDS